MDPIKTGGQQSQTPPPPAPGASQTDDATPGDDLTALIAKVQADPAAWAQEIKKLRSEAAQKRKAAEEIAARHEEASQKLAAIDSARAAEAEQALREQGKWKELAETNDAKLRAAQAEAESLKAYRKAVEDMLKVRLAAIPEALHKRIPDLGDPIKTLAWLDANADLFQTERPAPNLDQAKGSNGKPEEAVKQEIARRAKVRL